MVLSRRKNVNKAPLVANVRRTRIRATSASIVILLLGSVIGVGAMVFAVFAVHSLYHHGLFPELQEPQTIPLTSMLNHLKANIHDEADLQDKAKVAAAVEKDVSGVFIKNLLIVDSTGKPVYVAHNGPGDGAEVENMLADVNQSRILKDNPNGALDAFEGEKSDIVCRRRPIYGSDGKLIGAFVLHRALYPVPEKLAALQQRFFVFAAIVVGALIMALCLVITSAMGLMRKNTAIATKAERMQTLGTFASGLAHEIQNPLNSIALTSQYMKQLMRQKREKENDITCDVHEHVEKNLGVFHDEMTRIKAILQDFMNFARPIKLQKEPASLKELLENAAVVFETELKEKGIALDTKVDDGFTTTLDKGRIQQVFVNLIKNAIESMGEKGGKLTITASRKGDRAEINFTDTGCGMKPEQMVHLFEPYFTTKQGGQGLGLPITRNIVESHGGKISATSAPGEGSTFTVNIPLA